MSPKIIHWDGKFLANFTNNSATRRALANGNNWSMRAARAAAGHIEQAQQEVIDGLPKDMSLDDAMLEYKDRFDEEVVYLQGSLADYNDD